MTHRYHTERLAIVTGAAGGMGSACAIRLAAEGWSMILCDIDLGRLETVAAPLRTPGLRIDLLAGSIADSDFGDRLLDLLGEQPIGALIHTAGLSPTMGSAELIFAVNYDATARLVELARPRMARGGCAVLIASSSGYAVAAPPVLAAIDAIPAGGDSATLLPFAIAAGEAAASGAAYAISKRGVLRMVERQAAAFGKQGARIMSISPGLIDTTMSRAEQKEHSQMDAMLAQCPLARYGVADEIASVALFLCSPAASYVSGSDIKVDGGVLAAMS